MIKRNDWFSNTNNDDYHSNNSKKNEKKKSPYPLVTYLIQRKNRKGLIKFLKEKSVWYSKNIEFVAKNIVKYNFDGYWCLKQMNPVGKKIIGHILHHIFTEPYSDSNLSLLQSILLKDLTKGALTCFSPAQWVGFMLTCLEEEPKKKFLSSFAKRLYERCSYLACWVLYYPAFRELENFEDLRKVFKESAGDRKVQLPNDLKEILEKEKKGERKKKRRKNDDDEEEKEKESESEEEEEEEQEQVIVIDSDSDSDTDDVQQLKRGKKRKFFEIGGRYGMERKKKKRKLM